MLPINKEEKDAILKRFKGAGITRTMVNDSKRHHYYVVEDKKILQFLSNYRKRNLIESHGV